MFQSFSVDNLPSAPDEFGLEAKKLWNRLSFQLASTGLYFDSCFEYLVTYCRAYEMAQEAQKEVDTEGLFIIERGKQRINPSQKLYKIAIKQMLKIGQKMGFEPTSKIMANFNKNSSQKIKGIK